MVPPFSDIPKLVRHLPLAARGLLATLNLIAGDGSSPAGIPNIPYRRHRWSLWDSGCDAIEGGPDKWQSKRRSIR